MTPAPWLPFVEHDGGRVAAGFRAGNYGDCFVRAVAITTTMPYRTVHDLVRYFAQQERGQWRSHPDRLVLRTTCDRIMRFLGCQWTPLWPPAYRQRRTRLRIGCLPPAGRLVVSLHDHVSAVCDGTVYDRYNPVECGQSLVYGYWTVPDPIITLTTQEGPHERHAAVQRRAVAAPRPHLHR